jgi:uncharacterized YccA/Bax inhibitor family protein
MRTSNPALNDTTFQRAAYGASTTERMTLQGVVMKTGVLTLILMTTATWAWQAAGAREGAPAWFGPALTFGWILPAVLGLIIGFMPKTAPMLSPIYAAGKGVVIGILSYYFSAGTYGMVLTAALLTCAVLLALLAAYVTRLIQPSQNFRLGVFAATGGVALFYLVSWALGTFFHIQIPGVFGNGWIGIAFSGFVVVLAALNLVLDFDFIENGVGCGAPKYMEWYAAFGLLVTLVWLYIEILRLLAKLNSRR